MKAQLPYQIYIYIYIYIYKTEGNWSWSWSLMNARHWRLRWQCIKHARNTGFSLTRILPYKDKIFDFVLIRENMGLWKPVFSHILCSVKEDETTYGYKCLRIYFAINSSLKIEISCFSRRKLVHNPIHTYIYKDHKVQHETMMDDVLKQI